MVIWPDIRMGQFRVDDHRKYAPHAEKKSNQAYLIFRYHQKSWKEVMITFNGQKMKFASVKGHRIYFFNVEYFCSRFETFVDPFISDEQGNQIIDSKQQLLQKRISGPVFFLGKSRMWAEQLLKQ